MSVRPSVRRSVGRSVGPSVTHFFGIHKNGGKWSEKTFHISTGFLFQSHTLNLSTHLYKRVYLSVGQSVGQSVTHFFGLRKNGGKWPEMTFHISTGFLFQTHTLNLSFNIPHNLSFTILLPKSSFKVIFS